MSGASAPEPELMEPDFGGPHLVIVGAGASRATLTDADRNGRNLPLMADVVDALDLRSLLDSRGYADQAGDFEALYSHLAETGEDSQLLELLEGKVSGYFGSLALPDEPTLYDYLILCLRDKDVITSFNWDPLLWQAACRVASRFGADVVPQVLFLHGNAGIGYCMACSPATQGSIGTQCQKCGRQLQPSRLLFPVTNKDYTKDPSISLSWQAVREALSRAYILTVFGYGAPATDTEAVRLMKEAWGDSDSRGIESVEIIDIRSEDELLDTWDDFICRTHYSVSRCLDETRLMDHPRRSCEGLWSATMMQNPQPFHPFTPNADWDQLAAEVAPLIEQESTYKPEEAIY